MVSSDQSQAKSKALLTGLLFDDAGNRMIPTHATKNRIRYRYYPDRCSAVSQMIQRGPYSRVPADQIEALVTRAVRDRLTKSAEQRSGSLSEQNAIAALLRRLKSAPNTWPRPSRRLNRRLIIIANWLDTTMPAPRLVKARSS
jgi:hypothetical protein